MGIHNFNKKGEPVAKRTRAQTERMLCAEVEHMKKMRLEKWGPASSGYNTGDSVTVINNFYVSEEGESSGEQFDDDCAVFPGKLRRDLRGRNHFRPNVVDSSGEEDVVSPGAEYGPGSKESDEEDVEFLGVENGSRLEEDVIALDDDDSYNNDDNNNVMVRGRNHSRSNVVDGCGEEDVVFPGAEYSSGSKESDEEDVVFLGVENGSGLQEDVIVVDDDNDDNGDDNDVVFWGVENGSGLQEDVIVVDDNHDDNDDDDDDGAGDNAEDDVDDDDDDNDEEEDEERKIDDKRLWKACRKDIGKLRKLTKRKHDDVLSILINSLNMEKSHLDNSFSSCELTPPEKSDSEEESDPLSPIWAEMNFALSSSERETLLTENEAALSQEVETVENKCQQGDHDVILDEEFGLCCKHCNYVQCIRDIVPPFSNSPERRSQWRKDNNVDTSFLDELESNDSGFNSQSDYDPFSHAQGTVWDHVPGDIRKRMFPHQREGFEFIWNNIAGTIDLEKLKNSTSFDGGNGCIISHAPGTGKTGLSIVFLQSYMKLHPRCKPVIIAPCSMLLTWEEEFHKWGIDIPFHNLNKPDLSGKENNDAVKVMNTTKDGRKVKLIRVVKLYSWKKDGGVLGVSYRLFDRLANNDKLSGNLLDLPGLFIFDEGHTPRNGDTCIFKALSRIKTKRRIILSGTPFQNNFQELENTLSLVRQEFGEVSCTVRKRGRNRKEVKRASVFSSIGRGADSRDDKKLEELKEKIAPFVHVHKGTVLQERLPGLRHTVVVLQPDEFQKSLYKSVEAVRKEMSFVEFSCCVSLISVHPSLFAEQCIEGFDVDRTKLERLKLDPEAGIKTKFLLILLKLSGILKEKVLVFSQYLEPLTLIREQLKHSLNWREGIELLYMDGKQDVKKRQTSINVFNKPSSEARILLASTKACCEGINLVGASRVVLLDVEWNPFVERQAISRAYRLGQKKVVHVYHLILSGTLEEDKLYRQALKVRWSNKVFPSPDGGAMATASELLEDKILEDMGQTDNLIKDIIPQSTELELLDAFGKFLDKRN